MDCDRVVITADMRVHSLTVPACACTPAKRGLEVWSEEQGLPWSWRCALGVAGAALEPAELLPQPCLVQAARAPGR